jgi:serine/threonine-protein kinase
MSSRTVPVDPSWTVPLDEPSDHEVLAPGTLVGDYLVEEPRGRGGFGVVYLATEIATGRRVALKLLRRCFAASPHALERFQREVAALRGLAHPHIVAVLGAGDLPDGRPYLVTEWIEGRTLKEELRARGPFSPAEALSVIEEIGAALDTAHALGVVHRDVKAQNVMAVPRGDWLTTKLLDFGIAKLLEPERLGRTPFASHSSVLGTPGCMAPEQIAGKSVDARTDVYALGLLLYELCTGQPAFVADDPIELEELQLFATPPRAGDVVPLPPGFDDAIARCLEKSPALRPAGVSPLLADLRAALARARDGAARPAETRRVTALHVGVWIEDAEEGLDAAFDDAEAVLAMARQATAAAGLAAIVDGGGVLLAARALPDDPEGARAARAAAIDAAQSLSGQIAARSRPSAIVRAALTLHEAEALVRRAAGRDAFEGGELLRLAEWTVRHPGSGLTLTEAAKVGLAG